MVKKIIPRHSRRLNVLKIKSKNSFLLKLKKNLIKEQVHKKQSKTQLNEKEVKLLKNYLQSLVEPRKVKSKVKEGIEPGRVVILLAGAHKGKHAVVLKVLPSGLLLVTGPHKINGLPLRRVHQSFTIVTSTKLDFSGIKIDEKINDEYFRRAKIDYKKLNKEARGNKQKAAGASTTESNIFKNTKVKYELTEQRKSDQIVIDKQVLEVIKQHSEKQYLIPYLASHFYLKNRQYPHKLVF